jgi:hypothetical protein
MWVISGGVLAAYLEQQRDPTPITPGRGALTGLVSGIIGAVVWLIASVALNALMAPLQQRLAGEFMRSARDIPPEVRAMVESFGANSSLRVVFGFVLFLCVGAIFSTLGGVLGAAFFRNDVPPALGGPTAPPPLPPL